MAFSCLCCFEFFKQGNALYLPSADDNLGLRILNVKYFAYSLENESDYQ